MCTPPGAGFLWPGVMVQFWTDTPACPSPPTNQCQDPEAGGANACCTGDCTVIAHDVACDYQLLDTTNPLTGGITWTHAGMPPDASDPFGCPNDPTTGCPRERQLSVALFCDTTATADDSFTFLGIAEDPTTPCAYTLQARAKAACGAKGDPFEPVVDAGYNGGLG